MSSFFRRRNDKEEVYDSTFLKNGAILLEKLITSLNGKRNPFRSFSAEELKLATNNYDEEKIIARDTHYNLFKGFLKRPVSVMKYVNHPLSYGYCINSIVFASHLCHKNVFKMIGCCLETELPVLVFESVEYGTLNDWIHHPYEHHWEPLQLRQRLKIAMEIGNVVAYLHVGFPRPIVFRDLKPSNILVDENYVAKVLDFSLCKSIPEGETHIKDDFLFGTYGLFAPECFQKDEYNEKCDVFGFGALLLEILTGQKIFDLYSLAIRDNCIMSDYVMKQIENNTSNEIVDPTIVGEASYPQMRQQLQDFMQLISKCFANSAEDRPTMIDVAKQLRQLYLSVV